MLRYWYEVEYGTEQKLHYLLSAETSEKALESLGLFGSGSEAKQVTWGFMVAAVGCEIPHGETQNFPAHGSLRFCMKDRDYFIVST